MKALTIILFGLFFLSSCAGPLPKKALGGLEKVGVVSVIPNEMNFIRIGGIGFSRKYSKYDIEEWSVNDYIEKQLQLEVEKSNSFQVLPIDGDFTLKEDMFGGVSSYAEIDKQANKLELDAYILIRAATNSGLAPYHMAGVGILDQEAFGNKKTCIYSLYIAEVRRPKATAPLAWTYGLPCTSGDEDFPYKNDFNEYSGKELKELEGRLKKKLTVKIIESLTKLGLK